MIWPAPAPEDGDSPDSEYTEEMADGGKPVGVELVSFGRPSGSRPMTLIFNGSLAKPLGPCGAASPVPIRCPWRAASAPEPADTAAAAASAVAATRIDVCLAQLMMSSRVLNPAGLLVAESQRSSAHGRRPSSGLPILAEPGFIRRATPERQQDSYANSRGLRRARSQLRHGQPRQRATTVTAPTCASPASKAVTERERADGVTGWPPDTFYSVSPRPRRRASVRRRR